MTPAAELLGPFVARQDGVVTIGQARAVGLSRQQMRTLLVSGWSTPVHGVLVEPDPRDGFRAGLRAALMARPEAAACRLSAARLHKLGGLPRCTPAERPELIVPAGVKRAQPEGMRLYGGLRPGERVLRGGFVTTTLPRTVSDLALTLPLDDLICLLDSALQVGWTLADHPLSRRRQARLSEALVLADGRSESTLESQLRLRLVRAGIAPETLQLQLFDRDGICYARLDMAWPSRMLAVEADRREHHDKQEALYADRKRQNRVVLAGWTVLRFTWRDVFDSPEWVIAQVRQALTLTSPKS